jgi:hypothetical protein
MDTKTYISTLKKGTREALPVAMRQALCYFLSSENIPHLIISDALNISLRLVYINVHRAAEMLEINDKVMVAAYDEIKNHEVYVRPSIVDCSVSTRRVKYKLIIDNVIY